MSSTPDDPGQRLTEAFNHFVKGSTLLWRSPGMLRARAYFTALHLLPLGFACHAFYPGEHSVAVLTGYTTVILLIKAARGGPPPSPGPVQDYPDVTPA
ncbi:hypothetical protein [Nocardia carnea]|uniref:Uncharacterized protein n=1 Tax=Nocardia carnea TaxID=37328 RepID=A0ABW7TRQ3_9NOCA|nr:hypothetical protein [Nocardia carnea]